MKRFLGFVAIVLAIAACNTMEMDNQPAEKDGMITITAQLAPKTPITKAVADNGDNKITATWAVGEHLTIRYYLEGSSWTDADAEITAVDGNGTATISISFIVSKVPNDGTTCYIIYPNSASTYFDEDNGTIETGFFKNQTGLLNAGMDLRVGNGIIHTSNPATLDVTTQPTPLVDIFKFTIQDLADNDKDVTKFMVRDSSGNLIASVTPGSATGTFYAALPVLEADTTYWFSATIDNRPYIAKAKTSAATVAGKYYQSTVRMATIRNVIAANGKFYKDATAATADNTTAVAMITVLYPSNDDNFNGYHGRGLALSDAGSGNKLKWRSSLPTEVDNPTQYPAESNLTYKEEGLDYNDAKHNNDTYPAFQAAISNNGTATPPGCSAWYLPSGSLWNYMFSFFDNSYSSLRDAFAAVGGTNMKNNWSYWSCSEQTNMRAWCYSFNSSNHGWKYDQKTEERYVRSAIAF
jgi:hypothetical protein